MSVRRARMRLVKTLFPLALLVTGLAIGCGQDPTSTPDTNPEAAPAVTAIQGASWLEQLGVSISQTSMGQMGGSGSPLPEAGRDEPDLAAMLSGGRREAAELIRESFVVTGADLYRMNCQSCHGIDGRGAPPQISSVLPAVSALGALPADQAIQGFQTFLQKPGPKMPPNATLRPDEVQALLSYLEGLATPGSSRITRRPVAISAARVGAHVIGGTCHICHGAVGPGGGYMPMMQQAIPSLASFPQSYSIGTVENAVLYGASGMMRMMRGRETMPALPYFTEQEIAASYLYLVVYPPR